MTPSQAARWVAIPIGVFAISTSGILIRFTEASPLVTATHRLLWAAGILLVVALLRSRHEIVLLQGRRLRLLAASGTLVGIHFALWTSALFHTSVASAVLLTDTHPVLVAVSAQAFLGEVTSTSVWAGIALTLIGGAIIASGDLQLGGSALLGDAMALGAAATLAGYLVIGRRARQELGVATYAGVVYGIGGIVIGLLALASGASLLDFSQRDALLFLALVLAPTLAGHTVFNWSLRHVPASVVGVAMLGEPVVTTVLAWLLLSEPPGPAALIGGAALLAGVYLALRGTVEAPRRRDSSASPS
jgi:drug/metabolite transporter (DMT)-like permease